MPFITRTISRWFEVDEIDMERRGDVTRITLIMNGATETLTRLKTKIFKLVHGPVKFVSVKQMDTMQDSIFKTWKVVAEVPAEGFGREKNKIFKDYLPEIT